MEAEKQNEQACAARVIVTEQVVWENVPVEETKWCYLIGCPKTFRCKIGIADNWERRFKEIQASSPIKLKVFHLVLTVGFQLEAHLLRRFSKFRQHGEWFDFNNDTEAMQAIDDVFNEYYDATEQPYLWWDDAERAEWALMHQTKESA